MFSLYNVTFMHVFTAILLILNNQLVCSFLGEIISPTLGLSLSPVVLCIGVRLGGLSPANISMFIAALPVQLKFRQLC